MIWVELSFFYLYLHFTRAWPCHININTAEHLTPHCFLCLKKQSGHLETTLWILFLLRKFQTTKNSPNLNCLDPVMDPLNIMAIFLSPSALSALAEINLTVRLRAPCQGSERMGVLCSVRVTKTGGNWRNLEEVLMESLLVLSFSHLSHLSQTPCTSSRNWTKLQSCCATCRKHRRSVWAPSSLPTWSACWPRLARSWSWVRAFQCMGPFVPPLKPWPPAVDL